MRINKTIAREIENELEVIERRQHCRLLAGDGMYVVKQWRSALKVAKKYNLPMRCEAHGGGVANAYKYTAYTTYISIDEKGKTSVSRGATCSRPHLQCGVRCTKKENAALYAVLTRKYGEPVKGWFEVRE